MSLVSFLLTISSSGVTIWMRLQAVVSTSACNSSIRWWLVGLSRKAKQNEYSGRWCACMAFLLLAAAFFFSSCSRACTCIPLVVCEECHMYTLAVHNLTSHVSCTCSFFLRTSIPFSSPVKASETGHMSNILLLCSQTIAVPDTAVASLQFTCESIRMPYTGCLSYVFTYTCVLTYWPATIRFCEPQDIENSVLYGERICLCTTWNFVHSFVTTVFTPSLDDA